MNFLRTISLSIFSGLILSASAHVPFLKPNQFNVRHDRLQIESAFTEFPFQADFAMDSPLFSMTDPSGKQTPIIPLAKTAAAIYLEPTLNGDGTYRINAGVRKGPKYNAIETTDGKLYFAEDMKKKEGRKTFLQYFSGADTYLAKGDPAYQPRRMNTGVEIIPLSSPNRILVNDKISFQVFQNGKPVPNARIVVVHDNEHYEKHRVEDLYDVENVRGSNLHADKEGVFCFTPSRAGIFLLFVTVHKKINDDLWESYNTSLTFEVNLAVK
ncbi:MAG: nickel transport complex, nikm subunit, transmembrane [Bacteroidales bacterium 45-6]|nr:MAG: nickel transport complex, nikm subunit, transmembrane [Bacteroidales bacterium 45-6]